MALPLMPVYIVSFTILLTKKQEIPVAPVTKAEDIVNKLDASEDLIFLD
jgi:hypothetical protein